VPIAFDASAYHVNHTSTFALPGVDLRLAGPSGPPANPTTTL
jgi:hypothetical protein